MRHLKFKIGHVIPTTQVIQNVENGVLVCVKHGSLRVTGNSTIRLSAYCCTHLSVWYVVVNLHVLLCQETVRRPK